MLQNVKKFTGKYRRIFNRMTNEEKAKYYFLEAIKLEQKGEAIESVTLFRKATLLDPQVEFKVNRDKSCLNTSKVNAPTSSSAKSDPGIYQRNEEKAEKFYMEALHLERNGDIVESISLFHKATLLDPNVEAKVNGSENKQNECNKDAIDVDLISRFESSLPKDFLLSNDKNISDLNRNLIVKILKYLISIDFDLLSLENCALVSRRFYLCARDSEIWEMICKK